MRRSKSTLLSYILKARGFYKKQPIKHIQNLTKTHQKSTKTTYATLHISKHHKKPKTQNLYSFLLKIAQINATNHNMPVNPKKKFMIKISHLSL